MRINRPVCCEGDGVGRPGMLLVDAASDEQLPGLADAVDRHARLLELVEVGERRRLDREVLARVGPLEVPRFALERACDHAADVVLSRELASHVAADLVQLRRRDDLLVCRDLQHRVLAGVDDQRSSSQMLFAEVVDHSDAVVGAVADQAAAGGLGDRGQSPRAGTRQGTSASEHRRRPPSTPSDRPSSPCRDRARADVRKVPGARPRQRRRSARCEPSPNDSSAGSRSPPTASATCTSVLEPASP